MTERIICDGWQILIWSDRPFSPAMVIVYGREVVFPAMSTASISRTSSSGTTMGVCAVITIVFISVADHNPPIFGYRRWMCWHQSLTRKNHFSTTGSWNDLPEKWSRWWSRMILSNPTRKGVWGKQYSAGAKNFVISVLSAWDNELLNKKYWLKYLKGKVFYSCIPIRQ